MTNNTTAVLTDEQILALNAGEAHFSESPSKYLEAGHGTQYQAGAPGVLSFARAVERAILTSPRAAAPQWVLASDRLPDSSRTVLATYLNCSDKARRIRAQYVAAKTREASGETDELEGVYDEESDTYYWPEGWYECIDNWGDLSHVQVTEGAVTHWMEMPPLPGDAAPAAPVASPSIDIEQMLRDCVPGGDIVDPQLVCDNIRGWFADHAQAVAADGAAGGGWPMLSKGHLESLMFAYNEGWQKAYDGREFANPFAETGSQAAAWELGTRDGKERRKIHARAAVSPATADTTWTAPKQHCQNGGDVCLAGNHDGVCCPEDSCDIDDGTRKNPSVLPIKIPHVHIRPEDEEIGRQYYALGFVDGSRSITDAPQPATADEQRAAFEAEVSEKSGLSCACDVRGRYIDPTVRGMWEARQADRASQAAAPAEAREPDAYMTLDCVNLKPASVYLDREEVADMRPDHVVPLYRGDAPADAGEAVPHGYLTRDGEYFERAKLKGAWPGALPLYADPVVARAANLPADQRAMLAQAADFLEQKHSRLAAVTIRALLDQGTQGGKGGEA